MKQQELLLLVDVSEYISKTDSAKKQYKQPTMLVVQMSFGMNS